MGGSIKFIVTRTMSADLIVASFEFDKESSSFGFPFCAQVKKIFLIIFLWKKVLQGKQPKVKEFHFYPDPAKSFISQAEAQKFFEELNSIFYVSFPAFISRVILIFSSSFLGFLLGHRMPSISSDLTLLHLWGYWNINLRCSIQHYRISCESPAISSGNNLRNLSGH